MSIELAKHPLNIVQGTYFMERMQIETADSALTELVKKYFPGEATVVAWRMHKVIWGITGQGSIKFEAEEPVDAETILEMRVFDEHSELHIVRSGNTFVGRYIKDEGNQAVRYVDSFARLWGEKAERKGQYVILKDAARKLRLTVPCAEEAAYYGLVTRNYIGHAEENGQAGYVDYRFVKITSAEGGR